MRFSSSSVETRRALRSALAFVFVSTLGLAACSKPQGCPVSKVDLSSWPRKDAKYAPASFVVPPEAIVGTLPLVHHSPGEGWTGTRVDLYYRADSTIVDRQAEESNLTENVVVCNDSVAGYPVKFTLLFSKANGMPGEFGQATWTLPNHQGFYMAVLTPSHAARDTVVAILRSVRFKK
jgi:hypothetical protein